MGAGRSREERWPSLNYADWADTCATLHLWTQIVGKIRLAQMPWTNHSWHVALYLSGRGLTTSPMPHPEGSFEIELDLVGHQVHVRTAEGTTRAIELSPRSVAQFYGELQRALAELGRPIRIDTRPNEIPDAVRFPEDHAHAAYDPDAANRFWRTLLSAREVLLAFRARFTGKCSPVHFFWGSFDLAVTRFSGRTAPQHPGGVPNLPDRVAREAYSHEVSSAGFWPGSAAYPRAAFYSYAYPAPPGFAEAPIQPPAAFWEPALGEFILPYEDVRRAADPDAALLVFLQTTYEAAAETARWDRSSLEAARLP